VNRNFVDRNVARGWC